MFIPLVNSRFIFFTIDDLLFDISDLLNILSSSQVQITHLIFLIKRCYIPFTLNNEKIDIETAEVYWEVAL